MKNDINHEEIREIEKTLLMICINDYANESDTLSDVMIEIKPEYLIDPDCKKIFHWLEEFYISGRPISRTRLFQEVGLPDDFFDAKFCLPFELPGIIDKIKDNFAKRQVRAAATSLYNLAEENLTAETYRSKAIEEVFKYTDNHQGSSSIKTFAEALGLSVDGLRLEDSEEPEGIMSGFLGMDHTFGSFIPGHLTILAGQTSMGKTAFALNIVYSAISNGYKTLYISLEMTAKELADRFLITHSAVKASEYQKEISEASFENIISTVSEIGEHPLYISDRRGLTVSDIRAQANRVNKRHGLDFMVVDYLQFVHHIKNETTAEAIGHTVTTLRELAGELEIPIILLSQVNRNVDGRPAPRHIRGSGIAEEVADEIALIYRPNYEKETRSQQVSSVQEAELIIAKGRTKGLSFVPLYWYPEKQLFKDKTEVDMASKKTDQVAG